MMTENCWNIIFIYFTSLSCNHFSLQVLDNILESYMQPSEISRLSITVNGHPFPTYALNDILIAHPCPAMVSRFSFRYIILPSKLNLYSETV